jgi:outer membrane protein assembly factor BamB
LSVLIALLSLHAQPSFSEDWPGWRGPTTDLTTRGPVEFANGSDLAFSVVWRAPLGSGYSSVSVAHGVAVTTFSDGTDDLVIAFSAATGDELWRSPIDSTYIGHDGSRTGPISTPYITEGLVYALGPKGRLVAVETSSGDEVWTRDLVADYGSEAPVYGFTTSPLVVGDVLLLQVGGGDGKAVAGFNRHTGEPLWHAGDGGSTTKARRCSISVVRRSLCMPRMTASVASAPGPVNSCGPTRTVATAARQAPAP